MKTKNALFLVLNLTSLLLISSCNKEENAPPVEACFSVEEVDMGEPITLENCSSGGETYSWNFGDGNRSISQNPSHTYTHPGDYEISLVLKNEFNHQDRAAKPIHVRSNFPISFIVTKIIVKSWPETDLGVSWDDSDGPDLYAAIYDAHTIFYESSVHIENCVNGMTYVFGAGSGLPITISSVNKVISVGLYDDDPGLDTWMGGVLFIPSEYYIKGEPSITLERDEWEFEVFITWNF